MIRLAAALFSIWSGAAMALDFALPATATQTVERNTSPDTYDAPIGVFADGGVPTTTVEGSVARAAWRISTPGLTPFQVIRPLRAQLVEAGFTLALDCAAEACGGFDFRFATETLPGPNMYVNIRAYHMVTGTKQVGGQVSEVITVFASTSATSAYVQIIHAGGQAGSVGGEASAPVPIKSSAPQGDLISRLELNGHVVLADLDFATGSTNLGPGPFQSLNQLAEFLETQPTIRVALVGHTDTVGGLDPNIVISRSRARSVRQRLIDEFDIPPGRLDAEGMGYLSPVASNLSAAGRDQNRRVEVVLLSPD